MKLYVGNLSNSISEDNLRDSFKEYGEIQSLKIITDRVTGNSRGFAFVEMPDSAARNAISALNDRDMSGRTVSVSEAQEKKPFNTRNY